VKARMVIAVAIGTMSCSPTAPTTAVRTLTGDYWILSISAAPSCQTILPFGYGVAPRGGGTASLVQSGRNLSGTLSIFGTPSGTIEGTIDGPAVNFRINLDGRNVGVLSPTDEPCRVQGEATGSTDGYCFMSVKISGDFACPYSCSAADHILVFDRGRGCR
jgi:hypothetical protein